MRKEAGVGNDIEKIKFPLLNNKYAYFEFPKNLNCEEFKYIKEVINLYINIKEINSPTQLDLFKD